MYINYQITYVLRNVKLSNVVFCIKSIYMDCLLLMSKCHV